MNIPGIMLRIGGCVVLVACSWIAVVLFLEATSAGGASNFEAGLIAAGVYLVFGLIGVYLSFGHPKSAAAFQGATIFVWLILGHHSFENPASILLAISLVWYCVMIGYMLTQRPSDAQQADSEGTPLRGAPDR